MSEAVLRFPNLPRRVEDRAARRQVKRMAEGADAVGFSEAAHLAREGALHEQMRRRDDFLRDQALQLGSWRHEESGKSAACPRAKREGAEPHLRR